MAKKKPTSEREGQKSLFVHMPEALYDALEEFATKRGTNKSDEVRMAVRRHLAYPPPELAPLPVA